MELLRSSFTLDEDVVLLDVLVSPDDEFILEYILTDTHIKRSTPSAIIIYIMVLSSIPVETLGEPLEGIDLEALAAIDTPTGIL